MNARASLIIAVATTAFINASLAARASVPIPDERDHLISLDGTWRFKLEQAPAPPRVLGVSGRPIPIEYPTNIEPFYLTNYREDAAWRDLGVPGNWEMAGFSPPPTTNRTTPRGSIVSRLKCPAGGRAAR